MHPALQYFLNRKREEETVGERKRLTVAKREEEKEEVRKRVE